MKKRIAIVMCIVLIMTVGCTPVELALPTQETTSVQSNEANAIGVPSFEPDREYFSAASPAEYLLYVQNVFSTLLPLCQRDRDLGLGEYYEVYCADDSLLAEQEQDTLVSEETVHMKYCSKLPAFYGLLAETERYLADHSINYDDLAAPYGKAHALKTADVQAVAELLLRKPVVMSFSSVAGAEFVPDEGMLVYDALENPYQGLLDRGLSPEFPGSDLEFASQTPWGNRFGMIPYWFYWYDAASAMLYNPYGEQIGYTHNIEGLRTEFDGSLIFRNVSFIGSRITQTHYGVQVLYPVGKDISSNTPIEQIRCGSFTISSAGSDVPQEGWLSVAELTELNSTFFDDYYHDEAAGAKVTNYFLSSFYSSTKELDISLLPTKDPAELAQWCETYFGIPVDALQMDVSRLGSKTCEIPYVVFTQGSVKDGILQLYYYNEMLCQDAVLTLQQTESDYIFVSNLPKQTSNANRS